jgi:hypothetical protein
MTMVSAWPYAYVGRSRRGYASRGSRDRTELETGEER